MFRTRLVGIVLISISLLPGCRLLTGEGPRICDRCGDRRAGRIDAMPVGYPDPGMECGTTVIPPAGAPIYGAPIHGAPGAFPETMPSPYPSIPKAGIDEGKGKQFELDGAKRSGPVLTIPATNVR